MDFASGVCGWGRGGGQLCVANNKIEALNEVCISDTVTEDLSLISSVTVHLAQKINLDINKVLTMLLLFPDWQCAI